MSKITTLYDVKILNHILLGTKNQKDHISKDSNNYHKRDMMPGSD